MSDRYTRVEVTCPDCKISKTIDIPKALFLQKKEFGAIKIQIPQGAVCPNHQFIMFLDSEGKIRGYERIDLDFIVPAQVSKKETGGVLTLRKLIEIFGTYSVFGFIHAKIFNYPIFIIVDEDFQHNADVLNSIGNNILPERYRGGRTIHLYRESDYDSFELNVNDVLLLDIHRQILQIPWADKLKFEESVVESALEIIDEQEQLFLIQGAIANFIKEAECALEILENTNQISKKDLIKQISKELMKPKINSYRLKLIKEFINHRFSPKFTENII